MTGNKMRLKKKKFPCNLSTNLLSPLFCSCDGLQLAFPCIIIVIPQKTKCCNCKLFFNQNFWISMHAYKMFILGGKVVSFLNVNEYIIHTFIWLPLTQFLIENFCSQIQSKFSYCCFFLEGGKFLLFISLLVCWLKMTMHIFLIMTITCLE